MWKTNVFSLRLSQIMWKLQYLEFHPEGSKEPVKTFPLITLSSKQDTVCWVCWQWFSEAVCVLCMEVLPAGSQKVRVPFRKTKQKVFGLPDEGHKKFCQRATWRWIVNRGFRKCAKPVNFINRWETDYEVRVWSVKVMSSPHQSPSSHTPICVKTHIDLIAPFRR